MHALSVEDVTSPGKLAGMTSSDCEKLFLVNKIAWLLRAAKSLRRAVLSSLRKQGYEVHNGLVRIPSPGDKSVIRKLHGMAASHRVEAAAQAIRGKEDRLIRFIANGSEVQPERISPRLHLIEPGTENELLFRYASLHWSIPVSAGYGRRLRFLVFDEQNDKLDRFVRSWRPCVRASRPRQMDWLEFGAKAREALSRYGRLRTRCRPSLLSAVGWKTDCDDGTQQRGPPSI